MSGGTTTRRPDRVRIVEVGPRDGLQIEPKVLPTADKLALIGALAEAGLSEIEVTSFVNPRLVPQMADADQVVRGLPKRDGVSYRALCLNPRGLQRALEAGSREQPGEVFASASDTFSRRNMNRSTDQIVSEIPDWIQAYRLAGITPDGLSVMAAFGCNFEGDVAPAQVVALIERVGRKFLEHGLFLRRLSLADTMGWATPARVRGLIDAVRRRDEAVDIVLHLHDTRGLAIANAVAGLEAGVTKFESSIGGLGGCPFAGHAGASGNMCTEDFAFLCEEMGIETGLDLQKLIEASALASRLVGHSLPSKLLTGGRLPRHPVA